MTIHPDIEQFLRNFLRSQWDTTETLDKKVYLVGNMLIPAILICIDILILLMMDRMRLALIVSLLVWIMLFTVGLLKLAGRGVTWFLYGYYGGYIVLVLFVVAEFGGLPSSCGAWGGAFICFLLVLGLNDRYILISNALVYAFCLLTLGVIYPYLSPPNELTPRINNFFFTFNEIWMCLFLVKAFYDSILTRTEDAKKLAVHLEEMDLLRSKLYANVAHEFRTPLTLISGYAKEFSEIKDRTVSLLASEILQKSERILFLVNQMLNLSKIEEGHVSMRYVQTDVVSFVRYVVGSYQGYAEMRSVGLNYEPYTSKLMMDLEEEKLQEVLSNLLSNAIKYTPAGGTVDVILKTTKQPKKGHCVEIIFRDTGIGIPPEDLEKIFLRFYRVDDQRFPYQEGSGIGLTLVKEYVSMMGGTISVKSTCDLGSEFTVLLPVSTQAPVCELLPLERKPTSEVLFGGIDLELENKVGGLPRLLVIEDNEELKTYLKRLLGNEYRIFLADNGQMGITEAIRIVPDLIVTDVMMPLKDGFQVCRELKNDFRTSHIPVVMLTARADKDSRLTGIGYGADAYLAKPFNRKELRICLSNLLLRKEILRKKFSDEQSGKIPVGKDGGLDEAFMERVNSCLEKNFRNDMYGIRNLYTDIGISRVQLHRKLIALTGRPASAYIRGFRLQKARQYLIESHKSVTDIAFEVGFTDTSYFSKSFIQEYGINATELRQAFI